MIWTLGDFNSVHLLTGGGPADLHRRFVDRLGDASWRGATAT